MIHHLLIYHFLDYTYYYSVTHYSSFFLVSDTNQVAIASVHRDSHFH
nr:MAG TPA: hypothetical protein [Caudoviricetes sp.]